jgi:glycosyltransferase involved in cell wall biosynthesis
MVKQTHLPLRWVIVNDASTDSTAEIVKRYLPDHPWIRLVDAPRRVDRNFAGKVYAFNKGREALVDLEYDIIANLDSDISLEPDQFEFLLLQFANDEHLGVAGTIFKEENYSSETDSFEGERHVSGGCQVFRRACFDEIGGYYPNKAGGIDWMAVTSARMMGWKTRSFREKCFFHHRKMGTAERGPLASLFSYGEKDYYLGGHPLWELFRCLYRMAKRPYLFGGLALAAGYLWALIRRQKRPVSRDLMRFHRKEQMEKLRAIFSSLLHLKRVDNFNVTAR